MADYIIFDKAPTITFTCNTPIYDWYINTQESSEKTRLSGVITTGNCAKEFLLSDVEAEIKIRGNYTSNYSKKPFQIKFNDKQNLFGLNKGNKHKKWILLAEYNDGSMLRNALAFYMAQQMDKDTDVWVPTFTFAHFYITDSETTYYMGLYLLVDQKEQAKKRVNVFEPEDGYEGTDIGYFFERDDYVQNETDPIFTITFGEYSPAKPTYVNHESNRWARQCNGRSLKYDGYSIHSKITNDNQITYLKMKVLQFYEVLYRAAINEEAYIINENEEVVPDPTLTPRQAVERIVNLKSFVNTYILQDIVCNPDIAHSSFYLSLDMSTEGDKKLTLCCPWDFDLALGLAKNFQESPAVDNLWANHTSYNPWVYLLSQTTWFMDLVEEKWQWLYDHYFFRKSLNMLETYSKNYRQEFEQNFDEWDIKWEHHKTWNQDWKSPVSLVKPSYADVANEAEAKDLLETWVNTRYVTLHGLYHGQGSTDWPDEPEPTPPVPPKPPMPIWMKANNERRYQFRGLSKDIKPTKETFPCLGNGSILIEMDTGKMFMYDEENDVWYLLK